MHDPTSQLFAQAIADHQAGRFAEAQRAYRSIPAADPHFDDALYLLGTVLLQQEQFEESIDVLTRVVTARPDVPDAHNNLGVAYKAIGNWELAARSFEAAIKVAPDYAQAYFNLGSIMESRALFADAEKCYHRAHELTPDDMQVLSGLANALKAQQKWAEAETYLRKLASAAPSNSDVLVNLGYVLVQQERLDDAVEVYNRVLANQPDYCEVYNSLSFVFERQGRLDEAAAIARKALQIRPDFAEGYNNLGVAQRSLHQLDEAVESFQKALQLAGDFALADFNLGTTYLLQGRYSAGWAGYERRNDIVEAAPWKAAISRWDGQAIPGKTLLVHADQGMGDTIQFGRFLDFAQQRSQAAIIFECQPPLRELFASHPAIKQILVEGDPQPTADAQIPLAGIPGLLGLEISQVACQVPYLTTNRAPSPELTRLLSQPAQGQLKIGIAWQGNPAQPRDIVRSCPLEELLPLVDVANTCLFSLQADVASRERLANSSAAGAIIDLGEELVDFSDTAAAMAAMDLIITVDTAAAHLAGALGHDVWTLLCHTPDWRWHLDRTDSPWYPTMRLFRQPAWGDWKSVVQNVCNAITELKFKS